jgi:hypothetical protein
MKGRTSNIPALITAVSKTDGSISITTFPPGVSPQTQTGVNNDYRGIRAGDRAGDHAQWETGANPSAFRYEMGGS